MDGRKLRGTAWALAGAALVIFGAAWAGWSAWRLPTYARATGVVAVIHMPTTKTASGKIRAGGRVYRITYPTPAGNESYVTDRGIIFGDYSNGEEKPVLYNPADPKQAYTNVFGSLWLGPLVSAAVGFLIYLGGAGDRRAPDEPPPPRRPMTKRESRDLGREGADGADDDEDDEPPPRRHRRTS